MMVIIISSSVQSVHCLDVVVVLVTEIVKITYYVTNVRNVDKIPFK